MNYGILKPATEETIIEVRKFFKPENILRIRDYENSLIRNNKIIANYIEKHNCVCNKYYTTKALAIMAVINAIEKSNPLPILTNYIASTVCAPKNTDDLLKDITDKFDEIEASDKLMANMIKNYTTPYWNTLTNFKSTTNLYGKKLEIFKSATYIYKIIEAQVSFDKKYNISYDGKKDKYPLSNHVRKEMEVLVAMEYYEGASKLLELAKKLDLGSVSIDQSRRENIN